MSKAAGAWRGVDGSSTGSQGTIGRARARRTDSNKGGSSMSEVIGSGAKAG